MAATTAEPKAKYLLDVREYNYLKNNKKSEPAVEKTQKEETKQVLVEEEEEKKKEEDDELTNNLSPAIRTAVRSFPSPRLRQKALRIIYALARRPKLFNWRKKSGTVSILGRPPPSGRDIRLEEIVKFIAHPKPETPALQQSDVKRLVSALKSLHFSGDLCGNSELKKLLLVEKPPAVRKPPAPVAVPLQKKRTSSSSSWLSYGRKN